VGPATPAPSRVHFILPVRGPPSGVPRAMASKPPPPCRRRRGRGRGLALPGVHARARGRVRPLFRSPPPQRAPTRLATKDGRASHGSARCAGGGRDGARPPTRPCHAPRHPTCNLIRPSSQKGLALAEGSLGPFVRVRAHAARRSRGSSLLPDRCTRILTWVHSLTTRPQVRRVRRDGRRREPPRALRRVRGCRLRVFSPSVCFTSRV
jgi:hypothetical protein